MSLAIGQSYSKLKSIVFKLEGECITTLSQMSHNLKTNVTSLKRLTWGLICGHPKPHRMNYIYNG